MARELVFLEIGLKIRFGPVAQRIELYAPVLYLETGKVLAGLRLEGLASRNPAIQAFFGTGQGLHLTNFAAAIGIVGPAQARSAEQTSELKSLMRISYAVFCLKKKQKTTNR